MGIALMVATTALKHYSQTQSSVNINQEGSVPHPGGGIAAMSEAAVMKKKNSVLKTYNRSNPVDIILAAAVLSEGK